MLVDGADETDFDESKARMLAKLMKQLNDGYYFCYKGDSSLLEF